MTHAPATLLQAVCGGVRHTARYLQGAAVPFKDRFAIAGLGVTALGRLPGRTAASVKAEAVTRAVRDAGLRLSDIDGLIGQADFGADTGAELPRRLGIEPKFFWSLIAGGTSAISAIIAACGAIEAGIARHVVCLCGSTSLSQSVRVGSAAGAVENTNAAYGVFGPAADHALMARRHMHAYGTTPAQLGAVAVTMRANANRRPEAQMYGRPLSIDDYFDAPVVVEPLRRPDCCLVTDGGAAVVVTTAGRARELRPDPVVIMGAGLGHQVGLSYRKRNYVSYAVGTAKETAFREADITLGDIDFAELYEPFSIGVIVQLEDYGFCAKGEGGPFVEAGNVALTGRLPVNTGGGQASWGYLQGYTPLAEAVLQLTDRGGDTQLPGGRICLVTGHGATSDRSMNYSDACLILGRDR